MRLCSNICMCFFHWLCCVRVVTGIPPRDLNPVTLGDGALGSRSPSGVHLVHIFVSCPAVAGEASEEVPHHLPHTHCLPDNTGVPPSGAW